ncbi:MAG: SDR family NAD(P)-dependent oxidoreductase [Oscillospiraceae bacterium]|nr:SDR family NAD(P)-dependent oxidoreductase [Oscillospiraceae bacterium]
MDMHGHTILITGGATGIGFALAAWFHDRGNTVILCGRREDRLAEAAAALPGVYTFRCDVANESDRQALLRHVTDNFPGLNMLINNAGIQRDIDLTKGTAELHDADEVTVDLEAPIRLSALFTPLLSGKKNATIVHVSSGLAFMVERAARAPVYCAAKAGLHAFAVAQRVQLVSVGIRVVELIPPMVESELNREGRIKRGMLKSPYMMSAGDFAAKALAQMEQGADEIRVAMK